MNQDQIFLKSSNQSFRANLILLRWKINDNSLRQSCTEDCSDVFQWCCQIFLAVLRPYAMNTRGTLNVLFGKYVINSSRYLTIKLFSKVSLAELHLYHYTDTSGIYYKAFVVIMCMYLCMLWFRFLKHNHFHINWRTEIMNKLKVAGRAFLVRSWKSWQISWEETETDALSWHPQREKER